jgi:hypothetical protein
MADDNKQINKQTDFDEPIESLDTTSENTQVIYFKSVNCDKVFSLPYSAIKLSQYLLSAVQDNIITESELKDELGYTSENPIIILVDEGNDIIFDFIVTYLTYFNNIPETQPPPAPLNCSTHISTVFNDEYKLYEHLFTNDTKLDIANIIKHTIVAVYFNIPHLPAKLSACCASLLQRLSPEQIKSLQSA